jgi:outer membrane immunogenic protein
MIVKLTSLALAAGATLAAAAYPAAANEWNGPSIGIGGGYDMTNLRTSVFQVGGLNEVRESSRGQPGAGGFFSLSAGYDRTLSGPLVVGMFVDYDFKDVDTHFSSPIFELDGTLTLKNQLSAGGRIGYLISPSTLFFATVGYAHADSSDRTAFFDEQTRGNFGDFNGYFVGGGVEALVYDNFSIKAEYRYTSYRSEDGDFNGIATDTVKPQLQSLRLSLNYRFGDRKNDVVDNPPAPVTSSWTGPYLGIGGGYSIADNMLELDTGGPFASTSTSREGSQGGFISVSAGYDLQIRPRIVIGAFADADFANLHHSESLEISDGGDVLGATLRNDFSDILMVGGRLGYLVTPDTLLFASGGYANAGLGDTTINCNCGDLLVVPPQGRIFAGKRFSGAFIGGGIETKIWDALSIKAEYRYVDLSSSNVTNFYDLDPEIFVTSRMDPAVQMGRLSLNWRFNGTPLAEPLK